MAHVKKNADQLTRLQAEIEEFIRDSIGGAKGRESSEHVHIPNVDIYEAGDSLCIDVDLPGVPREDVGCFIEGDKIYVEARKKPSNPEKKAHYYCMERVFGKFVREIDIPVIVNTHLVTAQYDEGTLRIRLPKIQDRRMKKRRIELS